jgi:hypothetical protein
MQNSLEHRISVIDYSTVLKSNHCKPLSLQPTLPLRISFQFIDMRIAIDFDNQFFRMTIKIDDVGSNRVLTSKFQTFKSSIPERFPENFLTSCLTFSQRPSFLFCLFAGCVLGHVFNPLALQTMIVASPPHPHPLPQGEGILSRLSTKYWPTNR